MKRIGVFVCWCGSNIAEVVNVDKVLKEISSHPLVVHGEHYKYLCSEPGQSKILNAITEKNLQGVLVAACSPSMHEATFCKAVERAGLSPYLLEIVNIREQCSWVHRMNKEEATAKSVELIKMGISKLKQNEPLTPSTIPVVKKALVIGAGISGMQTALHIANCGYLVLLVEKNPAIGGHMAQLSETFPTLDCSQCILTPKTVEVGSHEKIKLLTYCEIKEISGYVGNFTVKIRKKAAYVDRDKCTGCGECINKCPKKIKSEYDGYLGVRKAIYIPYPQAVPNKPVIDKETCLYLLSGKCGNCEKVCPVGAINYEDRDEEIEEKVGAIVVATGYSLYPKNVIGEYGYGIYPDVIDGIQFERLNSASGPTQGKISRPSDGKVPKEVVFIQCVGSRDPEKGVAYCSRICCMYTAKQARLYRRKVPDGSAYVFYIDIRSAGKGYEEFVQRAMEEDRVLYLRGKVAKIYQDGDKIIVMGVDTLSGKKVEIAADLVVLATAIMPSESAISLAKLLKISTDEYGFMSEAHMKLRPAESLTQGIFFAGCAQAPKDIPDAVASAGAAASKVLELFSHRKLEAYPYVAEVVEEACVGCGICVSVCPYEARTIDEKKKVAKVQEVLCQGCGACIVSCPNGASQQKNLSSEQILSMIEAAE